MNHPRPLGMTVPTAPAFLIHSNLVQPQANKDRVFLGVNPNLTTRYGMVLGKGLPNYWGNFSTNRMLQPLSFTDES